MAKFKGVISHALPETSGVSKSGKQWRKKTFVLTYDNSNANYPKAVVFDVMGDNIDKLNLQPGMEYEVEVDFTVREYQGKYYQSASAWKATPMQQAQPAPAPANDPYAAMGMQPREAQTTPEQDDGLPF